MRYRVGLFALAAFGVASFAFPAASDRPTRDDLAKAKATLERILTENIIPFWYPQTLDRENGGYRLNHDRNGKYLGPSKKALVTQARNVWFFSRLCNSSYKKNEYLDAARHGYEFLRDKMQDKESGGFFTEVSTTGGLTVTTKHMYAQGFALYALTEYAKASGEAEPLDLARKLFATMDSRAYDKKYGGYRESFLRDWAIPPATAVSFMGTTPDLKLYNTHLHLMEPVTTYYLVSKDALARQRLVELIFIESGAVVRKTFGACSDRHTLDWQPVTGDRFYRASYGHDLENIWLLMEACDAAGMPNGPLVDLYRNFFDYAMKYGFDEKNGGFFYTGSFNQPADNLSKSWWVQAEALVSSIRMYQATGDKMYFDCFTKTLDWVVNHQVDWKGGDWFAEVVPNGTASGAKAGPWKAAYHNGRSMLECLKVVEKLIGNRTTSGSH